MKSGTSAARRRGRAWRAAAAVLALALALPAVPRAQSGIRKAQITLIRQGQILANTAATVAGARPTDSGNDGTLEPLAMRGGGGPSDGGLLPCASAAVGTDAWGTPLGYCAWNHGAVQGAAPGQAFNVIAPVGGASSRASNASADKRQQLREFRPMVSDWIRYATYRDSIRTGAEESSGFRWGCR